MGDYPMAAGPGNKPSKEDKARERKYRAECDLRALHTAREVMGDEERMKAVQELLGESQEMYDKMARGMKGLRREDDDEEARRG